MSEEAKHPALVSPIGMRVLGVIVALAGLALAAYATPPASAVAVGALGLGIAGIVVVYRLVRRASRTSG